MKTILFLVFFEIFALLALFYYEANKPVVPPYEAEIDHIAQTNDSLATKLNSDVKRLDSLLEQSKAMRKEIEILTKQK